ncbi:hypothetical protein AKJ18_31915 [Vibrio xuii]|nr:hypothetical protein AKJ18_31915 [Vibrio xuii]
MIGTSAALAISGIPFNGPIGAARVGHIDGQLVLNPSQTELEASKLDLVVAGTESAVLMVESEADNLTEEEMLAAVVYGPRPTASRYFFFLRVAKLKLLLQLGNGKHQQ